MNSESTENTHHQTSRQFTLFTINAAAVAAFAAWGSAALGLEVWVMFAGFIAWFTRPGAARDGVSAVLCLWLGVALAALVHGVLPALMTAVGTLALPVIVFAAAVLIVGLRATKVVGNMLGWFLGMVTFFAADPEITREAFGHIAGATGLGGIAGWVTQTTNRRWAGA